MHAQRQEEILKLLLTFYSEKAFISLHISNKQITPQKVGL